MDSTETGWSRLSIGWRQAFEQAWTSWCEGNLGIGAALVDPLTGGVVSAGRNRVGESSQEPNTLSGNFMAHAEMNALAAMPRFKADGLHLYTTLEPCLMCAATSVFLHVEQVHFAAADEYFEGVDELWDHHPYSRRWKPQHLGPLTDRMAGFARVLPLSVEAAKAPDSTVMAHANDTNPEIAALAVELAADRSLHDVRARGGSVEHAVVELWPRLPDRRGP